MRKEITQQTEIGLQIEEFVRLGEIVPEDITFMLVKRELTGETYRNGYVGAGFKTLGFAQLYVTAEMPTHVFYLTLSDESVRTRLIARGREDDTPKIIETRLWLYRSEEHRTRMFWQQHPDVECGIVSTEGTIESASQQIFDFVTR